MVFMALEEELGAQLFDRSDRRRLRLTDAGVALRRRAEQILALVDDAANEVREGVYSFPCLETASSRLFPGHGSSGRRPRRSRSSSWRPQAWASP